MKVLVVDSNQANKSILADMLEKHCHQIFYVCNDQEVVDFVTKEKIDVVFVEVIQPTSKGIDTIKLIRSQPTAKWVHIEIITASFAERDVVLGLEAGADGYITKPINHVILDAKLRNYERSVSMQLSLLESNKELKKYHEQNEMENNLAKDVFDRLIRHELMTDNQIKHWLLPSSTFSGDLIGARRDETGCLYFFIADATGHGLAAALPTMVVNQVFRALINKGFAVADIAREINQRLYLEMPTGRFVALVVGKVDFEFKTIEIWNGGLPDLLVISNDGKLLFRFPSIHVFAGVLGDNGFDGQTDKYHWQEDCELIAYSDGITDALNVEGQQFGQTQFLQLVLTTPANDRIDCIKEALLNYMDKDKEQDDVSCLSICCR